MAASEQLTRRLRDLLESVPDVTEKKMFSGIAFMVNDKMCINVGPDYLMVRVDPKDYEELVGKPGCSPMVMRGREMTGFLYVDEDVLRTKRDLNY